MIFKRFIYFAFILFLIPFNNWAQVHYSDQDADYIIETKGDNYSVRATLRNQVESSRRLQLNRNRLRLKAVDLVGNYIIFQEVDLNYPQKDELFDIFMDHSQLHFDAQVEKFKYSTWDQCDGGRCIYFTCLKKEFNINSAEYSFDLDVGEMLQIDFDRKKSLESAARLLDYTNPDLIQAVQMENVFLSGRGELNETFVELMKSNKNYHLQNSLFGDDSLFFVKFYEVYEMTPPQNYFAKLITDRILFTAAPIDEKQIIYNNYTESLKNLDGLWWEMQLFASEEIINSEFPGWDVATVFDVIGHFPVILNFFNMNIAEPSQDYVRALELFTIEDFDGCLRSLQKEINFNGISSQALNLIGATYRLKEEFRKAIPFLLLSYQMNTDQVFVKGNIFLCMQSMDFPQIDQLQTAFLNQPNIDLWSKNQIENSKNTKK